MKSDIIQFYQKVFGKKEKIRGCFGGGIKMFYEEDEYYEDEDSDIYKKAMRSLLLEDDEISEIEEAFMEGYEYIEEA